MAQATGSTPDISQCRANALADRPPRFHGLFLLPLDTPRFVAPCILHRRFPVTAGDWPSISERVRAKQRAADAAAAVAWVCLD